jgi:hypothetical protein
MSKQYILKEIRKVRWRLNMQKYLQRLVQILLYSLLICVPLFIIDSLTEFNVAPLVLLWLILCVSGIAFVFSALRPVSLHEAARTIDRVGSLKDRVVSALEFIQQPSDEPLTELQIKDTLNHLQTPKQVARYSIPRKTALCALIMAVLLTLSSVEFFGPSVTSDEIDYSLQIAEETEPLLKHIEEIKEEARQMGDQELAEIIKQLETKTLELAKARITPKEALAKLTELDLMVKSKMSPKKLANMESLLKELGQKFMGSPIMGNFGSALNRAEYKKAAKALDETKEKIEKLPKEQRQNLSDDLKQAGKSLEDTDLDALGADFCGASSSMEEDDLGAAKAYLSKARRKLVDFDREKIRNLLLVKLLSQCQMCKAGVCGACNALGNNMLPRKSKSPSNSAGKATDPNPFGEMTTIDSALQLERIAGLQGEGPSAIRMSETSPEGQQSAVNYKDVYTRYQELSEEALSQEHIPLGYKYYIKRYFESIRPAPEGGNE